MATPPPIRILNVNTHVGDSIRLGGLRRVRRQKKPHIVTLQEVQRPGARLRARLLFNPLFWHSVGLDPKSGGAQSSGTLVFARKSRFKLDKGRSGNRLISPGIPGDNWHPERRLTKAILRDKQTECLWRVMSAHTWTLARPNGREEYIRAQHTQQVDAYAFEMKKADSKGQAGIAIGDWNERVGDGTSYVERQMGAVGARDGRTDDSDKRLTFDEMFVTDTVEVLDLERIPMAELDTDHDGLCAEVAA